MARPTRTILIVDDEPLFRKSLAQGLEAHDRSWRVLTAENGLVARELLECEAVDLVLTDLAMPESDGFELLAYLVQHRPGIPALVLTAYGTVETGKRLETLGLDGFLEKPVDFDALLGRISAIFQSGASGFVRGISLPTFLQILELDGKSCKVQVRSAGRTGQLYVVGGVLHDAETGKLTGEAAAAEIVCWEPAEIAMSTFADAPPRRIEPSLRELMLDSFRQRDELQAALAEAAETIDEPAPGSSRNGHSLTEAAMIALDTYLEEFKGIKGYIASGIMDFTGETLAVHSMDPGVKLEAVGAVFNDIFRGAHEASSKIGLDACTNMALNTPKGVIVMECSGATKKPHLHGIVILQEGGNQALAKMTLSKVLPLAVKDLT